MQTAPCSRWYRLHWLTWFVITGEIATLVYYQLIETPPVRIRQAQNYFETWFGWPIAMFACILDSKGDGTFWTIGYRPSFWALPLNILAWSMMLGSSALLVDSAVRKREAVRPWCDVCRFVIVVAVGATLICRGEWLANLYQMLGINNRVFRAWRELSLIGLSVQLTAIFAASCAIYALANVNSESFAYCCRIIVHLIRCRAGIGTVSEATLGHWTGRVRQVCTSLLAKHTIAGRPWYRLHWLTMLVIVVVVMAITECQEVRSGVGIFGGGGELYVSKRGWPFFCIQQVVIGNIMTQTIKKEPPIFTYNWRGSLLSVCAITWLAVIASAGTTVELWVRKPNRWQFTLAGILRFTTTVAGYLTLWRNWPVLLSTLANFLQIEPHEIFSTHSAELSAFEFLARIIANIGLICLIHEILQ